MKNDEFETGAKKLIECYPNHFSKPRLAAIFQEVKDLDARWWAQTVKQIILSGKAQTDIAEAARAQRLAKKSFQDAKALCDASDAIREHSTSKGLQDVLKQFGAKDLVDAIGKKRNCHGT